MKVMKTTVNELKRKILKCAQFYLKRQINRKTFSMPDFLKRELKTQICHINDEEL